MRYRYVAFDLDGTLIDSEEAVLRSLQDTLLTVTGKEYPLPELTFSLGITGEDCLKQLALPDPMAALALWEEKLRGYQHLVKLFPAVPKLLETLAGLGVSLGAVTSKTTEELAYDFIPLGLPRYLPTVVTASDTVLHKPEPDPLLKFMAFTGAAREETLYVGDSPYDSECARRAGVDFALAHWGCKGRTVPAKYAPAEPLGLITIVKG